MKRVLVLGAYGLIGAEVVRGLIARGHDVSGFGRAAGAARRAFPDLDWHIGDLREYCAAADWRALLEQVDVVVNCVGALQDTPRDDLAAVHTAAVAALAQASAEAGVGVVQISAVGVGADAGSAFLQTKHRGDMALADSGATWWILRPGLVLAPSAWGGTMLLRMLAAVPWVQPYALGGAQVQTVAVADVVAAVARAVEGALAPGQTLDLVEPRAQPLRDVVFGFRDWLGTGTARVSLALPEWAVALTSGGGDLLGRLGWRAPVRSAALDALRGGVVGDAAQTRMALGRDATTFAQTLARNPARLEDRIAARVALCVPVLVATLFAFWFLSGVIGVLNIGAAAEVLTARGWSGGMARASVGFWAVVDVALALALLWRPWAARAALGMAVVCGIYLVAGSLFTPDLWADPLGPFLKVLPAMALSGIAALLLQER